MDSEKLQRFKRRLRATLASQSAAYGFTLTIWGTGALGIRHYGAYATIPEILAFVLGPLTAYSVLVLTMYRPHEAPVRLPEAQYTVVAFLDFASVPAALGIALVVYNTVPWPLLGMPVAGFAATLVYNLLFAAQVSVFLPRQTPDTLDEAGKD